MKASKIAFALALTVTFAVPSTGRAASPHQPECQSPANPSVAPPSGFDPLTASKEELRCYGFPKRPTQPDALASWTAAMKAAKHYVVPVASGVIATGPEISSNWAGYIVHNTDQSPAMTWDETIGQWNVPKANTSNNGLYVYPWVGMGGDGSPNIIQAGTSSQNSGSGKYNFWWEDYPSGINLLSSPSVNPGDQVYVNVSYNGDKTSSFLLEDVTTGNYTNLPENTPNVSQDTAEFIVEEPQPTKGYTNFGTVTFSQCYAYGWTSTSQYLTNPFDQYNIRQMVMTQGGVNGGTVEAAPSNPPNSSTHGFAVYSFT